MTNNFNVRQMQAYAALCLWQFCNHLGVRHASINELIQHLFAMLTALSLPDWEQEGTAIAVTGRGDPLPEDVSIILTSDSLDDFNALVESCVEVGIVDMYGASTSKPAEFVERCIEILKHSDLEPPSIDELKKYGRGSDAWGDAINNSELDDILSAYGVSFY